MCWLVESKAAIVHVGVCNKLCVCDLAPTPKKENPFNKA